MTTCAATGELLRAACHTLGELSDEAAPLEDIRQTLDEQKKVLQRTRSVQRVIEGVTGMVLTCALDRPLDEGGRLIAELADYERHHARFVEQLESFLHKRGDALAATGREGRALVRAIEMTLGATRKLHDATVRLRWAVMEHDAELSPVSEKTYDASNLEELFSDLQS